MCGINGILALAPDAAPVDRDDLIRVRDRMVSRGPDGDGEWISEDGRVGFGHRRLAIIDLSPSGLQPMTFESGRFRIVFNGEIYNYRQLREELEAAGVVFRTQSDTEVIMALYERHGAEMFPKLRGMYAMALWDESRKTLLLARDPYGIKPLYYAERAGQLHFASQVKALHEGAGIGREVDPAALVGYLLWGSIPEPRTMYSEIHALPAGHYIELRDGVVGTPQPHYRFGPIEPGETRSLEETLSDTVAAHLVSDVPVAVFLSAGFDSSLIAALAARKVGDQLTTLTLQFDDFAGTSLDEAPVAAQVAAALGTRHVERKVCRDEFLGLWPEALAAMDQLSIDGFNTYVVSRVAREAGIKVVLSGLGGDELFGSYASFRDVPRWADWTRRLRRVPGLQQIWPTLSALRSDKPKLRGMLKHGGSLAGAYFLRHAVYLPDELPGLIGLERAREGLAAYDPVADSAKFLGPLASANGTPRLPEGQRGWEAVHVMESTQFMRNQLLRDSDWASMAHSVELRVPLVDPWLRAEIGAAGYEPARTQGKGQIARRVAPELPEALWNRPKSGFWVPVMEWIDKDVDGTTPFGQASRMLALRVLDGFGIEYSGR
ncbi:MAG: asparagine synthase (glutamine-hydrolyzing) [bacterium]|nr:asparagine synthase (glutamine-hydrolyzing) [bacterium]